MSQNSVSRRDLARHFVAGATATFVGTPLLSAGDDSPNDTEDAQRPEALSPLDVQMAWLFHRYSGEHLTDEQIAAIRRDVSNRLGQSAALRQYPLEHGDAPGQVFAAYRRDG